MKKLIIFAVILITSLVAIVIVIPGGDAFAAKKDSKYDRPYDPFFERPQFWSPGLSPNGNYIASARRVKDDDFIIIQNLNDTSAKPAGINLGEMLEVQWVRWVSDDRLIYYVVRPWDGGIGSRPIGRLFGIDRDGKNNFQFFRNNRMIKDTAFISNPISDLPNDPDHVMIPVYLDDSLDVLKLNVNTGKFKKAASGIKQTRGWYADVNGDAAFFAAMRDEGRVIDYYARLAGTSAPNAKWRVVKSVRRDRTSNSSNTDFLPVAPGAKPSTYYVIARPAGENTAGVHLYDFETNTFLKKLAGSLESDARDVMVDWRTGKFEGAMFNKRGKMTFQMSDPLMQKHYDSLAKYFGPSLSARPISTSADGTKIIFLATGPGDPGSYHLYDVNAASAEEIGVRMTNLLSMPMATGRVVTYKARDGLELYGYLTRPPGAKPGDKPPLIMMPHGGPEARTEFGYDRVVQLLAWRGYQVFEPNFRGSTGRGIKFADKGRRQWGKAMQNDIDDALMHLDRQGIARNDNACIMGFSYGGYAALAAATLTPDTYKCAISGAPPADLIKMLKTEKSEGEFGYNYWTRHIGDMNKDYADIVAVSPAQNVENINIPILLHHGTIDWIVPYEQGKIMLSALKGANKDVTWVPMGKIGHWSPDEKDVVRNDFYDALFEFLDRNLPVN